MIDEHCDTLLCTGEPRPLVTMVLIVLLSLELLHYYNDSQRLLRKDQTS